MKTALRLAYIPTRRPSFPLAPAAEQSTQILATIQKLAPQLQIITLDNLIPNGILSNSNEAASVTRYLQEQQVDCLFVPHCNFGCEEAVGMVASRLQKPVLLWGPRDNAPENAGVRLRDTQCGLFASSKLLQRLGIVFTYITNSRLTDDVFQNGFLNFLRTVDAVRHFQNARIGQISPRPKDFCSVVINEGELQEQFGTQVIPTDIGKIAAETKRLIAAPNAQVKDLVDEMHTHATFQKVSQGTDLKLAAFEAAILHWAKDNELDAIALQCWDTLQLELGISSCFIHGEITQKGIPVTCETDIHGALTSLLLQGIIHDSAATFLADLTTRHPENDNAELLWHCGPFSTSLAQGTCEVDKHYLLANQEEGICNCQLQDGPLTIARFDGIRGKYSLFCGEGKTVQGPYNRGGYVYLQVPDWPLWEEKLIYGPYIHHVSGIFGNFAHILYDASRYIPNLLFDPAQPTADELRKRLREAKA